MTWLMSATSIIGMTMVGRNTRSRAGWMILALANVVFVVYYVATRQYGLAPVALVGFWSSYRQWWFWTKASRKENDGRFA